MDYVEKNLLKDEKIVLRAKISWLYLFPYIVGAILFIVAGSLIKKYAFDQTGASKMFMNLIKVNIDVGLLVFVLFVIYAIFYVLKPLLIMLTTKLAITNKRILGKTGILSVHSMDMKIEKADNVMFSAGAIGNILHYYTLTIKSTSGVYTYHAISNAEAFKNTVTEAMEAHAAEMQQAQASAIANAINKKD